MYKQMRDKNKKNDYAGQEKTFWQHLEELRWNLIRSIIVVLLFSIIAFLNRKIIFDQIILAPKDSEFITYHLLCKLGEILSLKSLCINASSLKIINISLSGQFMTHVYVSIVIGLILAAPYIIWEIWRFIKPALKENEKKYSKSFVLITSSLFLTGILFSYFLIVPFTIRFLGTYHVSSFVQNTISLKSYINTVVSLTFAVGLVFELPVLVYFLTEVGMLTPSFMRKNRKYMFILILILAAIITPPDAFSQIMLSIPLVLLYEWSIHISKRVVIKKNKLQN